jgi:tetratricopeptide (TPR) repeat protein
VALCVVADGAQSEVGAHRERRTENQELLITGYRSTPYNAKVRRILLAVFLLLAISCHRAEERPPARRVIFVGLDGADWQLLDRFIADGTMPNLAALAREGDKRPLFTQHPPLSPLVWTTMMTGVSPLEHRILDFTRFHPSTHEKEPITSDERAVPAIWNMASSAGKHVDVFGLWATYPAEEINGTMVSDRLFSFQYDAAPPPHAVFPETGQAWATGTVQDVSARTGFDALHRYVPSLTAGEYETLAANPNPFAHPVTALRRVLIETEVMHRLATERIERDQPELTIVYFQGTDAIGHLFAPYFPPKLAAVSDQDFNRYHDVPRVYFARIDSILGDYRRLAQKVGARLVIASDHGFRWVEGRSPVSSVAIATAAKWHREEGIFLRWPRGGLHAPNSVVEICPTLLELLDMSRDVAAYRRTYHRAAPVAATPNGREEIAKLEALGYIGAGERSTSASGTRTAGSFNNEGLILLEQKRDGEAMAAFESALNVDPKSSAAMWNLSELLRRKRDPHADALLDEALAIDPNEPRWLLTRGRYRLERHDCKAALADFERARTLEPNDALAFASIGTAQLCIGNRAEAQRAFDQSLALDPNQPGLRRALRR